jgi:hypothetical protein
MLARMWLVVVLLAAVGVSFAVSAEEKSRVDTDVAKTDTIQKVMTDSLAAKDIVYASYFHGDRRCPTCMKLEAYSSEAIQSGFEKEVKDSLLVFRTVNWDREENAHYIDDYKLFTKALILSRVRDGKEIAWTNLDSIWQYVGDKETFIKYVQAHSRAFIDTPVK